MNKSTANTVNTLINDLYRVGEKLDFDVADAAGDSGCTNRRPESTWNDSNEVRTRTIVWDMIKLAHDLNSILPN